MKSKANIRPYMKQLYRGNRGYFLLGLTQTLFSTASALLISWLLQQITDLIGGVQTGFTLWQLAGFAVLGVALSIAGGAIDWFARPRFIARAITQYKEYVFDQLSRKGIAAFSGENTSLYISALSNDVNAIENGYLSNLFRIAAQAMLFAGALALMLWYNPVLTAIAVGFALLPLAASLLTGGWLEASERRVSERNASYMSMLRDALAGFAVIKSFRAEKQLSALFSREVQSVADAKEKRRRMGILVETIAVIAGVLLQIGVFLVGAYLALSGSGVSAGSVLVFVQLLNFVISPIRVIPQAMAECRAAKTLVARLAGALSDNVRQEGGKEKSDLTDGVTLENLTYAYEEGKPVLQGVSFRFEAGKSYCLVGASGSGKSTLLNLMMASDSRYEGSIRYDDTELREMRSDSLYSLTSLVQQSVFIFNASIRDNITMFTDFPREETDRAIRLSGLEELIRQRGGEYLCGENGSGLSGGEKQRISIARGLMKKAQVLLADEATAALDHQTASQVTRAILGLQGLTRIVVTHSLDAELLRGYDCILTMKNGVIAESGSFEDLMERKGYFYSLYTVAQ